MIGKTDFIVNGSFELQGGGDSASWIAAAARFEEGPSGALQYRQSAALDGWTLAGGAFFLETFAPPRSPASWDGKVWAFTSGGQLSQDVPGLAPGAVYDLTFVAFDSPGSPEPSVLQVFWNDALVADLGPLDGESGVVSHLFVVAAPGPNSLEFRTFGTVVLDDVRLFAAGFTETADFASSTRPIAANLGDAPVTSPAGTVLPGLHAYEGATAHRLNGVRAMVGGDADDLIYGGAAGEVIEARAGQDRIFGGDGANYLRGDLGNDTITGGGAFDDINGNMGDDSAAGGEGGDWVVGGKDNDVLSGDGGADIVYGNLGGDTCAGGAGDDLVRGGQQNDRLSGGDGADWLSGDRGDDTVTGGQGADVFHTFGDAALDLVTDFNRAQGDRVLIDAGVTYAVSQSGADVVIDMTGGGRMVLAGVSLASLA